MASISKEVNLDASPERVWEAVRDFDALHKRLVPGFVTDAKMDGDARGGMVQKKGANWHGASPFAILRLRLALAGPGGR